MSRVGVAETPVGEGGAGGVAGQSMQRLSADPWATVEGANGAKASAGSVASQPRSAAGRPAGGESADHGSSLSSQYVAANKAREMPELLAGAWALSDSPLRRPSGEDVMDAVAAASSLPGVFVAPPDASRASGAASPWAAAVIAAGASSRALLSRSSPESRLRTRASVTFTCCS